MSFCPTKDIHSVYLDNELPEEHKQSYEKHLEECESCRAELEKMKAVRKIFQEDASNITPDEHYLDESYQRLMIKMSYNRNVSKARKPSKVHFTYILSAAAAVLVALFIPNIVATNKATPQVATAAETPVTSSISTFGTLPYMGNNISFGSGNRGVVSGIMNESAFGSNNNGFLDISLDASPLFLNTWGNQLLDDNVISIRITIPSFDSVTYTEPQLNGLAFSGNYQWNLPEN